MALTERQKQISDLLDQGKTPAEIAKKLKITENAVYQQRRRIKQANGGAAAKPKRATTSRKAAAGRKAARKAATRRSAPRKAAAAPAPAASAATPDRPLTPLQAIRARRDEITVGVKAATAAVIEARKALKAAEDAQEKARAKVFGELAQLDMAEAALTGKPVIQGNSGPQGTASNATPTAPKRQSGRKGTGQAKAAQPLTPDPEGEAELAAQAKQAATNGAQARQEAARLPAVPDSAPESALVDVQAALDGGAEFEELDGELPVGVASGFEQPDEFGED